MCNQLSKETENIKTFFSRREITNNNNNISNKIHAVHIAIQFFNDRQFTAMTADFVYLFVFTLFRWLTYRGADHRKYC